MQPKIDESEEGKEQPEGVEEPCVVISFGETPEEMRSNMCKIPVPEGITEEQYTKTLDRTVKAVHAAMKYAVKKGGAGITHLGTDDIYFGLRDYVLFQDEALRQVSVAVSNHLKQIPEMDVCTRAEEILDDMEDVDYTLIDGEAEDIEIARKGLFILGNTGTGKTHTLQTLADLLGVPFVSVDATRFTIAGYKGADVEEIYEMAKEKAKALGDENLYKYTIFHFDEVDKLVTEKTNGKDVNGGPVLESLLGHMQSGVVRVSKYVAGKGEVTKEYDTSSMLFVFSGACEGIEDVIKRRLNIGKNKMGFAGTKAEDREEIEESDLIQQVKREDLANWGAGFPRQFLGRIGAVIPLRNFSSEQLAGILTEPKNSFFDQYRHVWQKQGMYLRMEDGAVEAIAEKAVEERLGARGLTHVLDPILNTYQFDLSMIGAKGLTLTGDIIEDRRASRKYVIMEALAEMGVARNKSLGKRADEVIASLDGDCLLAQQVKGMAVSQYSPKEPVPASGEA